MNLDSNESASFRAPRLQPLEFSASSNDASKPVNTTLSSAQASSPPFVEASHDSHAQEDELPPPIFSAPPASIPQVASQLESGSQPTESPSLKLPEDTHNAVPDDLTTLATDTGTGTQNGFFQFGFSQVAGILESTSNEIADTGMQDRSDSSEQFALHYSQLIDTDAMTQI